MLFLYCSTVLTTVCDNTPMTTLLWQLYSLSFICSFFTILRANRAMSAVLLVIHMCLFYYPTANRAFNSCHPLICLSWTVLLANTAIYYLSCTSTQYSLSFFLVLSYVLTELCQLYSWSLICVHFTSLRANRAMPIVLLVIHMCLFYYPTCQQGYANFTLGHSYVFILLSYVPTGLWQMYSRSFICSYFPILRASRAMAAVLLVVHMFLFSYRSYVPAGLWQLYSWSFICF